MLLADDILLLPWKALMGIFRKIHDTAKRETSDEKYTLEKLLELQLRYEMDEITEEEYDKEEVKLQAKLNALREADEE